MRVDIDGVSVELMGDPHLGKRFVNGVPLHRRGEREAMVWDDFGHSLLLARDADLHVCMGDLFDKPVVPYEVLLDTAETYLLIAANTPHTTFVVLRGNHDQGRDLEAKTAFDVFAGLVAHQENIKIIYEPAGFSVKDIPFAFFPWSWMTSLDDLVDFVTPSSDTVCFFHADVDPRNGGDNLIPTKVLAELGIKRVFTGHDHKPRTLTRDGVDVTVVGSLQPFAFGEEVDDKLYVTVTYREACAEALSSQFLPRFSDKVVRVDLLPGEPRDLDPELLNCLQLVYRGPEEQEEEESPKVELGDFDLDRLAGEVFAELGVEPATTAKVMGLISSQRMVK